jgi:U-box domain
MTSYKALSIAESPSAGLDFDIELDDSSSAQDCIEDRTRQQHPLSDLRMHQIHSSDSDSKSASFNTSVSNGPPANYICPITLKLMLEPMNDGCGHSFDKEAILDWLEYHGRCPISLKPLSIAELHPNQPLASRIQQWRCSHGCGGVNGETPFDEEEEQVSRAIKDDMLNRQNESLSKVERMLLPQERQVFRLIHDRSVDLRRVRQKRHCIWTFAAIGASILLVAAFLSLRRMQEAEN